MACLDKMQGTRRGQKRSSRTNTNFVHGQLQNVQLRASDLQVEAFPTEKHVGVISEGMYIMQWLTVHLAIIQYGAR